MVAGLSDPSGRPDRPSTDHGQGERLGARGVELEQDPNKGDARKWRFIMSPSAKYFEIINCFNLIHLLISIPPSPQAVMKRQLCIDQLRQVSFSVHHSWFIIQ